MIDTLKAARKIVEKGWHQGAYTDDQGSYCILGALNLAETGNCLACCGTEVMQTVQKHLPHGSSIPNYNDNPRTTKQDVLHLFDKAIADLGGMA